jgi:hopene-associated glycosyltransferase HpnB
VSCLVWVYLLVGRGGFWRCTERLDTIDQTFAGPWPSVVAVIPARDEIEVIERSVASLLEQKYPGVLEVIVVDDHSSDGTAEAARRTAVSLGATSRLTVLAAPALPPGWTGKLWALDHGIAHAEGNRIEPDYFWLTDADIVYDEDALVQLVRRSRMGAFVLTSVMAKLRCVSHIERTLIPAFVFFFQMLYPFAWVNDPARRTAAAAGGCMLVKRDALNASGGLEPIRRELIDDCALARRLKKEGAIWLGFSDRVHSLRAYPALQEVRRMIARSAYCQLRYSPVLLVLTVLALSITYFVPVIAALAGTGWVQIAGFVAWGLMICAFQPTLRLFGAAPAWAIALPAIALVYLVFTLDSAIQYSRARGGLWKGRAQAAQTHRG